jgi:sec-independent protein translocase protein TatB
MLASMFGIGGSEIIVILIVALLFLGPEKLPEAAKTISKGIRDLRRSTKDLQQTIENDTQIGGALRDIKSALRGEEPKPQRLQPRPPKPATAEPEPPPPPSEGEPQAPVLTAPLEAGEEASPELPAPDDGALAAQLIRPATGSVSKASGGEDPQG